MPQCRYCRRIYQRTHGGLVGQCLGCSRILRMTTSLSGEYKGREPFLIGSERLARIEHYAIRAERNLPLFD